MHTLIINKIKLHLNVHINLIYINNSNLIATAAYVVMHNCHIPETKRAVEFTFIRDCSEA